MLWFANNIYAYQDARSRRAKGLEISVPLVIQALLDLVALPVLLILAGKDGRDGRDGRNANHSYNKPNRYCSESIWPE